MPATITEAGSRLRDGSLTSEMLIDAYLKCIRHLEPKLRAFITITEQQALADGRALDTELRAGKDRGPLHGIPVVYKDNYDTADVPTTMGSELFRKRVPREDATVVRLLDTAGTVMLGKTNMNELAAGGPGGYNKFFGTTRNPWHPDYESGGSSSGSAVAVAAALCLGGVGTDSGGSIRGPASRTGIVGIRPTFGRVSCAGVFPRAPTLDICGPLARTVMDAALLLSAIVGFDSADPHSLRAPREDFMVGLAQGVHKLRLGIIDDFTFRNIDSEVSAAVGDAVEKFAELGAEIVRVKLPSLEGDVIQRSVTNVLLYEFNKVFGRDYRAASPQALGPVVHSDMAIASHINQEDYDEALSERQIFTLQLNAVFGQIDALLTPTMPTVAPLIAAPDLSGRHRQFTLPFSFAGLPALSVPCGFNAIGLPIGLQIIGNTLQEGMILRIAAAYERVTGFYRRRPPLHCGESVSRALLP